MSVSKSQKRTQSPEVHLKKEECSTESERQNAFVKTESEPDAKNNHKRAIKQQPADKITPQKKPDKPLLL
jgi:hypothetical protein